MTPRDFIGKAAKITIERCAHPNRIRQSRNCCVGLSDDIAATLIEAWNAALDEAASDPWITPTKLRAKKIAEGR